MTDTQVITFYTQYMTLQGNLSREIYRRFQATYKNPEINVFIFELFDKRVTLDTKKELAMKILTNTTWISEIHTDIHQVTYQKVQRWWSILGILLYAAIAIGNKIST